jgi:uroporphyrinogen decarboxylase
MNSRERVITALNHEEPDRVPIDLGGTGISTIAMFDTAREAGRYPVRRA